MSKHTHHTCTNLHSHILYCIALYCTVLCCTVLWSSPASLAFAQEYKFLYSGARQLLMLLVVLQPRPLAKFVFH